MENDSRRARWFFLGAAALCIAIVAKLLPTMIVGMTFAYLAERPIDWMLRKVGKSSDGWRWAAAGTFTVFLFLVAALPIFFITTVAIRETMHFVSHYRFDEVGGIAQHATDSARSWLGAHNISISDDDINNRVRGAVATSATAIGQMLANAASATPQAIFTALLGTLTFLTFAVTGKRFREAALPLLIPWKEQRDILRKITAEVISSVVVANLLVALVQCGVITLTLVILRIPRALVWGILSFFLAFVPVIGTATVTFTTAIYCFTHDRTTAGIIMVICALIVGSVDNFLKPLFMRGEARIGFLWMFIAFIGGITFFGGPGVILGPLSFALLRGYARAYAAHLEKAETAGA